jgi:hypothetical protein
LASVLLPPRPDREERVHVCSGFGEISTASSPSKTKSVSPRGKDIMPGGLSFLRSRPSACCSISALTCSCNGTYRGVDGGLKFARQHRRDASGARGGRMRSKWAKESVRANHRMRSKWAKESVRANHRMRSNSSCRGEVEQTRTVRAPQIILVPEVRTSMTGSRVKRIVAVGLSPPKIVTSISPRIPANQHWPYLP